MMPNATKSADRSLLRRSRGVLAASAAALLVAALAAPARADLDDDYGSSEPAGYDTGYSYIRVLDGSATLLQGAGLEGDAGERTQAEVNQPVLAGDRLWVGPRSRVEVALSDRNLLRVDGETEVAFLQLAFSPESGDRVTTVRLVRGNVQLVVTSDSLGDQLPRLDTLNATVYPQDFGVYRITSDGGDWTEAVVRRGRAEVVSGEATVTVTAGEEAQVEGDAGRWADVRDADGYDGLERWAEDLDRRARDADVPYVDQDLRYAAAPLEDHGRWVDVSGSYAWRPRVDTGWRPYWHGRWDYTPAGVTWVSHEPWGWVPYHYGTWDYAPGYGWVWFPGRRFSPAWVYWQWGASHVAWVPVGYYTRHYGHGYPGFRFGVYGWAGGDAGFYADWVFCDRSSFGRRHHGRRHGGDYYHGHDWHRRHGGHSQPRGILTTDTRPLRPSLWNDPQGSVRVLRTRPGITGRADVVAELPDVTPFVSRRGGELPGDVAKRVAITRGEVEKVAGTPLAPGTRAPEVRLARPRTGARADGADGVDAARRTTVTTTEPGVRSANPATGIRGEAPRGAGGERTERADPPPRARSGRPVAVERTDAPRAESPPAAEHPSADRPSGDRPAAGRPGVAVRRSPADDNSENSGDRGRSLSGGRAARPRSGGGSDATLRRSEGVPDRGLSGSSPRAERPATVRPQTPERGLGGSSPRAKRPATVGRQAPGSGPDRGLSASSPRAERPATVRPQTPERGAGASSPRAERPATVRPRTVEPWSGDRRGSAAAGSTPSGPTVRRSAPQASPPAGSAPRAARPGTRSERPEAYRAPVSRAPSAGVRAPAQRSAPIVRSQPAPSRPPAARRAPVVRSQPRSGAPAARSAPSRAPVVRSQPSRSPAPRSTPSAGSSGRGGGGGSSATARSGGGSSRGGGGAARPRGGSRDRD